MKNRLYLMASWAVLLHGFFLSAGSPEFEPDVLSIKLKRMPAAISKSSHPDRSIRSLGVPNLDRLLERAGAMVIEQRFPGPEGMDDPVGIRRIFRITLPRGANADELIQDLSADIEVEYAERIVRNFRDRIPDDSLYSEQQHLTQIMAPQAWDIHRGEDGPSVIVAIVDDAVDWRHPDLAENAWQNLGEDADGDGHVTENAGSWILDPGDLNGLDDDGNGFIDDLVGWDFASPGGEDNDPGPENQRMVHGTHVAGLAAGRTNNQSGIAGIGWNVRFLSCKHDEDGEDPFDSDLYEGIVYAADQHADVINMSWGSDTYSKTSEDVIQYAWSQGCMLVGTAGNDDGELPHYPSDYSRVLSVASVTGTDRKASYSNFGMTVDICAPGGEYWVDNAILSTVPGGYRRLQGTSMAAPVVSGLLALIQSYHPGWTPEDVITQLLATADGIDEINSLYAEKLGYGRINAYRALSETNASLPRTLRLEIVKRAPEDTNGNLAIEPGETVKLGFRIHNYSPFLEEPSATFLLTSEEEDIEIIDGSHTAAIPADGSVILHNIFEIRISPQAGSHIAELRMKIESDLELAGGNEMILKYLIDAGGILVWEPFEEDPNTSGRFIYEFLEENSLDAVYINDFPYSLSGFDAAFLCFGPGSPDYPEFDAVMSEALKNAAFGGTKLYIEGCPNGMGSGTVMELLGLRQLESSTIDILMKNMSGKTGILTEGMLFTDSFQPDQRIPELYPRSGAQTAFQDESRRIFGVWYEGVSKQKIFWSSFAVAGWTDGNLPSTRFRFLANLLKSFGLLPAQFAVSDFKASQKTGHAPLAVTFTDLSFSISGGSADAWEWTFGGGDGIDSESASPVQTFEEGLFDVRLKTRFSAAEKIHEKTEYIRVLDGTSALDFNGGTSLVTIPASDSLNFTDTFTFEAWIYPRSWGEEPGYGYGRLMDKETISILLHDDAGIYNEHSLVLTIDAPDGSFYASGSPSGSIMPGQWSHVAVSFNVKSGTARILINGESQSVSLFYDVPAGIGDHSTQPLCIGNRKDRSRAFDGTLDDVCLWNTERSETEIRQDMTGSIEKEAGLIGFWDMNEGTGSRITDKAWGHTGTGSLVEYVSNTSYIPESDTTGIAKESPYVFRLFANSPNPFNPSTIIRYTLPAQVEVNILIYDVMGRKISTLVHEKKTAGIHEAVWKGTDDDGRPAASGLYFCRIQAGMPGQKQWTETRKMMLLR